MVSYRTPCTYAVAMAASTFCRWKRAAPPHISGPTRTVALGLRTALTQDNGFVPANEWIQANLPVDARISVTNSTGHFAYMHDPRFGIWPDAPLMEQNDVNYVLTQSKPTRQGYGYANPAMLAWLEEHATPMVTTAGPTNGETTVWYVDPAKRQAAAAANVGVPSKSYGTER